MDTSWQALWKSMFWGAKAVVIVLLIMSIYSIWVMVERYITFSQAKNQSLRLLGALSNLLRKTTGANPDGILYEPATKRLFTFNGRGKNTTVFDAKSGAVAGTIDLGGKPEFAVTDGSRVYLNIEDTSEIAVIDPKKLVVEKRSSLAPCESPSGLALDRKHHRLFSVCENEKMAVTDDKTLKVVATVPIGKGVDGAAFDEKEQRAFSSNGADGTMTVVREVSPAEFRVEETVPTARGARTIALDTKTHHLFLPTAQFGPLEPGARRPPALPNTFELLEVGK